MTAKQILELIETADPKDTENLDEIDARVWCFLNQKDYIKALLNHDLYKACHFGAIGKYTRSRDVLKAIRPEGWCFDFSSICHQAIISNGLGKEFESHQDAPTEELAELHAIIQAIEWERSYETLD